jgi:PPM family protein phosphatase
MPKHIVASSIHQGARTEQQDFFGTYEIPKLGSLFIVCDGMGGPPGGKIASEQATRIIIQSLLDSQVPEPRAALENAIAFANRQIFEFGKRNSEFLGLGTTVTAVLLHPNYAVASHVGDSRIYLLRNGKKVYRSNDHSKVFEQYVNRGQMTEEEARTHEEKSRITRYLGIGTTVEVETQVIPYIAKDRLILCSDGIWESMPEEYLLKWFTQPKPANLVAEELSQNVLGLNHPRQDNLTILAVDIKSDSKLEPPLDMRTKTKIATLAAIAFLTIPLSIGWWHSDSVNADLAKKLESTQAELNKLSESPSSSTPAPPTPTPPPGADSPTPTPPAPPAPRSAGRATGKGVPADPPPAPNLTPDPTPPAQPDPTPTNPPVNPEPAPPPVDKPQPAPQESNSKGGGKESYSLHTVKKGETLNKIADRYHVSVDVIKKKIS